VAVNKITGFRAPYKSDTFRDIVDSIEGVNGLLDMDGPITQVGPTITVPAFRIVQDGLIVEKTVTTTLSEPSLDAPFYLVVTAPTPNPVDDLIFTFAKTPEDVSASEVILGAYDGFEWRVSDKLSIKGVYDLIAQTNIDTLNVGPFSGLRTSLNGGNYDNSPGTLVDQQGQTQRFEEIASFPVVAVDPDWSRIDRILYRRPTDSINRVGLREFLLGGTYSASPASLTPVESFDNTAVRQTQRILIAADNTAHILSVSGSGTNFQLDYTKISSDRLSTLIAPTTLFTGMTSKSLGAAIDGSGNFHVVYEKAGNICYRKFSSIAGVLVTETVVDTQSGACAYPAISIDPASTKVFIVYQSSLGPSNNQIFFTARTLGGALVTSPKNIAASAQNLITPDIFVSEDLFVYVAWENDTLGSILYRRFDDIGDPLDAAATTVSTGVEQIGVGTLTGNAKDPRILVTGNREVILAFRQDKGSSVYGISVYTRGAAFMQELTGPAENFEMFDLITDPIFNSLMFTAVQASSVDFIKVYDETVSFVLNLAATGSRAVAVARDRLGSLLHAVADAASGTYTSYDATTSIIAFGATSVVGGVSTINVGANQFLVTAATLSQAPDIDDQVVITGSGIGGNNSTRLITNVELMSLNAVDDVYRVTVANNFTAAEDPSTANGNFKSPDGNNAVYIKSVSEALDHVFSLFELDSDVLLSRMVAPGTTILNWLPANSAGGVSDFLVLHGSGTIDWEATSPGDLTLSGTVKITNIFTSSVFTLTPGSYGMAEGDALYVVVDDTDLTPTPQVTPIATLPWNEPIGVLGIIANGVFEPGMPNLRPLSSTEQFVLGESLPVYLKARLGINSDTSYDAYTSTEHIASANSYPEAISNLDTAVQNIIGQIFMTPESPISKRVALSGVDKTLLKGSIFGAKYKEHLLDFGGAVINFQTGVVYEEDGTTPLGVNFTPVIPAAGTWRWFAVNLLPGSVGSDNRLSLQLKVTPAASNGASQAAAPRATFAGGPDVGQVAVFSSDGVNISNIDYSNLLNLVTNFSTSEASPGSQSSEILVSGNISMDWESTTVGEFTFASGLRIQDLVANVTWLPVAGGYAMSEGDALYILLDTSALTPTPLVAAVSSLPFTSNIYVIGVIRDGYFVPTSQALKTLESGENWSLGDNLSNEQAGRLGLTGNIGYDAYGSTEHINSSDDYPAAISNLDTAVQNIIGQIFMEPQSPISKKVKVSGVDKTLLKGSIFGAKYKEHLIDFTGAVIDFASGSVYEDDGTTPLGVNFTPVIPAAGTWRWYAVNLLPGTVGSDNRLSLQLKITAAASNGASQAAAPRATFAGGPDVGQVAVFSSDGLTISNIDYSNLLNLVTNFSTSEASPGGDGSEILVSGNVAIDWSDTVSGSFTFASGLRVQDLLRNVTWLPVAGSYAMTEGQALYIVLDTSALTPTPLVAAVASLPVTSNIYVIGVIRDGYFVPTSPFIKTLEAGENWTGGQTLSNEHTARLGLSGNISYDAYSSTKNIGTANDYAEAISNLDLAVKYLLEQIKLKPKSPTSSRVVVTGVDKTLYETSVLGLEIKNYLIDFDGAEIDFSTGNVYQSDGITPLGTNFTPVIPAAGTYRWFAVNIKAGTVGSDNRIALTLIVTAAASNGASLSLAPVAKFKKEPKVGQVAVFSTNGSTIDPIGYSQLINVGGSSGSGGGGLTPQYVSSGGTAEDGIHYQADTSGAGFAMTLPAGSDGSVVMFSDTARYWHINQLTITPATGEKIDGLAIDETLVCDVRGGWVELSWNTTSSFWSVRSFALTETQVATQTQAGIVSTGSQVFGGQKNFADGIIVSGGTAANFGLWAASNVLHVRGGTSGFSIDNTSAASIASATDAGAWTFGPSSSDSIVHTSNGSLGFGTLITAFSSAAVRYVGSKYASQTFRLNGSGNTGYFAFAGAYFDGTNTNRTNASQTAARFGIRTQTASTGKAFTFDTDSSVVGAADSAASLTEIANALADGTWTFGPATGSDALLHNINGSLQLGSGHPGFSSATSMYMGNRNGGWLMADSTVSAATILHFANMYHTGAATLRTNANESSVRISAGGGTTASAVLYKIDIDASLSHAADSAISVEAVFQIDGTKRLTYGGSSGLGTGSSAFHTMYGSHIARVTGASGTGLFGGRSSTFFAANVYIDGSGNAKAVTTGGSSFFSLTTSTAADTTEVLSFQVENTNHAADGIVTGTKLLSVLANGSWSIGPTSQTGAHNLYGTSTFRKDSGTAYSVSALPNAIADIFNSTNNGTASLSFTARDGSSSAHQMALTVFNQASSQPVLTFQSVSGGAVAEVGRVTYSGYWKFGGSILIGSNYRVGVSGQANNLSTAAIIQFGDNANANSRQFAIVNGRDIAGTSYGNLNFIAATAVNQDPLDGVNGINIGFVSAAGAWTFGPTATNGTHTIQGKTVILKLSAAGAGDASALDFYTNGAARARIYTDNSAGLTFYRADLSTSVGSFADTGAWTLGKATNGTAAHLIQGAGDTSTPVLRVLATNGLVTSQARLEIDTSVNADSMMILKRVGTAKWFFLNEGGGSTDQLRILDAQADNGVTLSQNAGTWGTFSDERIKEDLADLEDSLEAVLSLRTVKFKWKASGAAAVGIIAQDVDRVLPEVVDKTNPERWSVRYSELIPLVISALKELKAENDELKRRIDAL
jgi:hypothetical protein